ncbi:MAG: rod shape-determining protein RodA [Gemmatimonadetes bacterium]|nr:rod shape-determining protein RodA [Gemmatimonadota bacterium]
MISRIWKAFTSWAVVPQLVIAVSLTTLFGILMIYSAGMLNIPSVISQDAWIRQLMWWCLALFAFTFLQKMRVRWLEWFAYPLYGFSCLLLLVTLFYGSGSGTAAGVSSFLDIGFVRFQPAEIAKITTVLALAKYISTYSEDLQNLRDIISPSAFVFLPLVLVILQPDLGTALSFIGILFAILFWAGTPIFHLILLASPGLALILSYDAKIWAAYFVLLIAFLYWYRSRLFLLESVTVMMANLVAGTISTPLWNSLADYQKNRILVFLDPTVDPRGAGYHVIQSMVAIGSGGMTGKGFMEGTQKMFNFLPEQHTDFIFSVIGEELGFLGTIFTLGLFSFIFLSLLKMAEKESDVFAGLVIFGILGAWMVHVFVNIGMTINVVPVTGIPLPFVSYGGSFLFMSWVAIGIATRVVQED